MSSTRVLVLGFLTSRGPAHGYEILRQAQLMNIEEWADVSIGSLYHALRTMTAAGLLKVVRVEKNGNFPTRRVYAMTAKGERELVALLERTLADASMPPDPFDVALTAGLGRDLERLPAAVASRKEQLESLLFELRARRDRLLAEQQIGTRAQTIFLHQELRLEAEIRFHEHLERLLPQLFREAALWATGIVDKDACRPVSSGSLPSQSG